LADDRADIVAILAAGLRGDRRGTMLAGRLLVESNVWLRHR